MGSQSVVRTCLHMSPYGAIVHELKTASREAAIVIHTYGALADASTRP